MNYLLIAATSTELAPYLLQIRAVQEPVTDVDILITGVGLTATTYALTRQIALKRPDCIIQAGIAGTFDPLLSLGSVMVVGSEIIADQGVMENSEWKTTVSMGFTDPELTPYTGGWLVNPDTGLNSNQLPVVRGVSVNQISTDSGFIDQLVKQFEPVVESMEGAALHYVAISESIPFLQLRAVSNRVGERDKSRWDFKNAILNLNKELLNLLPIQ